MKVIPIARYLADHAPGAATSLHDVPVAPRDHRAELDDALNRGREEGREAARLAYEEQRKLDAAHTEERIAALRAAWAAEEAEKIAAGLAQGLQHIETAIASAAANLLKPILSDHVRAGALDSLAAALAQIRSRKPGMTFAIAGPADLLDELRNRLPGDIAAVYRTNGHSEVTVETDLTIIETCIGAWAAKLAEHAS